MSSVKFNPEKHLAKLEAKGKTPDQIAADMTAHGFPPETAKSPFPLVGQGGPPPPGIGVPPPPFGAGPPPPPGSGPPPPPPGSGPPPPPPPPKDTTGTTKTTTTTDTTDTTDDNTTGTTDTNNNDTTTTTTTDDKGGVYKTTTYDDGTKVVDYSKNDGNKNFWTTKYNTDGTEEKFYTDDNGAVWITHDNKTVSEIIKNDDGSTVENLFAKSGDKAYWSTAKDADGNITGKTYTDDNGKTVPLPPPGFGVPHGGFIPPRFF